MYFISYGNNYFSKNLESFYKSKEILHIWSVSFHMVTIVFKKTYIESFATLNFWTWNTFFLALPTYQEICSFEDLAQIDFGKFDLRHPVWKKRRRCIARLLHVCFSRKVHV